jgi:hypothetical protein
LTRKGALWILLALFGAVAIWFTASHSLKPRAFATKASIDSPPVPAKKASASIQAGNNDDPLMTLSTAELNGKLISQGPITGENPIIDQKTPIPTPSPPVVANLESNAPDNNRELPEKRLPEVKQKNLEKEPRKNGFKTLEKERREAERKRSRLEEMYQKGLISAEAYKDGQEEYKSKIEKYRREAIGTKQTQ